MNDTKVTRKEDAERADVPTMLAQLQLQLQLLLSLLRRSNDSSAHLPDP